MKSSLPLSLALVACHALTGPNIVSAGEVQPVAEMTPAAPKLKLNMLLQLDVSDHYITPRGLNVEDDGVIFQPLVLLFANLYSSESSFISSVDLTAGIWSSFHTEDENSGPNPSHWNEFDPIFGLSYKFAHDFKFETNYTAFKSMTDAYPLSHHLELKLSYDDSKWMGGNFAINPYVAFWKELDDKATVAFDPSEAPESYYFTLGMDPTVKFDAVKLEFPTFINIVGDQFYQQVDGSPGGSGLAVFCTGVKASVPLKFIPQEYGFWTWYAQMKYYHLSNDGLEDGNKYAFGNDDDDLFQFNTGLSIFF